MNAFVVIGALLLIGVVAGYIVMARREIGRLPPLKKQPPKK